MRKWSKHGLIVAFVLLAVFQIKTTNIKTAYSFTPAELDLQIKRMNYYPPSLARVGYILETKKAVQLGTKFIDNVFFVLDFNEYIPNRIPIILSPLLFIGLYFTAKERKNMFPVFQLFLVALILLSIVGPHAKYGPVLLMPFLWFFVIFGILKLFRVKQA